MDHSYIIEIFWLRKNLTSNKHLHSFNEARPIIAIDVAFPAAQNDLFTCGFYFCMKFNIILSLYTKCFCIMFIYSMDGWTV